MTKRTLGHLWRLHGPTSKDKVTFQSVFAIFPSLNSINVRLVSGASMREGSKVAAEVLASAAPQQCRRLEVGPPPGSQQHGLLQGERLLGVPVVLSSEQLGVLLSNEGLLLLQGRSPVGGRAVWEREHGEGRQLSLLEAGRARHPPG